MMSIFFISAKWLENCICKFHAIMASTILKMILKEGSSRIYWVYVGYFLDHIRYPPNPRMFISFGFHDLYLYLIHKIFYRYVSITLKIISIKKLIFFWFLVILFVLHSHIYIYRKIFYTNVTFSPSVNGSVWFWYNLFTIGLFDSVHKFSKISFISTCR